MTQKEIDELLEGKPKSAARFRYRVGEEAKECPGCHRASHLNQNVYGGTPMHPRERRHYDVLARILLFGRGKFGRAERIHHRDHS